MTTTKITDARMKALRCTCRGMKISAGIARGMRRDGLVLIVRYVSRGQYAMCELTPAGVAILDKP